MSGKYPHLSSSHESFVKFVKMVSNLPQVEKIILTGSRSPIHPHEAREDSDWDIQVISKINFRVADPRKSYGLNADLGHMTVARHNLNGMAPVAVELYPNDTHDMLKPK